MTIKLETSQVQNYTPREPRRQVFDVILRIGLYNPFGCLATIPARHLKFLSAPMNMSMTVEEFKEFMLTSRRCAQCDSSSADVFCHKNCEHVICQRCRSDKPPEKCPTCGVSPGNWVIDRVFQQIYSCILEKKDLIPPKTPVVQRKVNSTPRRKKTPATPDSSNSMKRNAKGETYLHEYCCRGFNKKPNFKLDTLKEMLAAGANPNTHDAAGITPMHEAVEAGNVEILQALLDYGGQVNCYSADKSCNTPLHLAAERFGHLEPDENSPAWKIMTTLLNAGANIFATNSHKMTPLLLIRDSCMRDALVAYRPAISVRKELIVPAQPIVVLPLHKFGVQNDLLSKFSLRFNISHHFRWGDDITHIVVLEDDYMNPNFTLRIGILKGLYIVKKEWLEDSLEADDLLPADRYEIARPILINCRLQYVSRRARINYQTMKPKLFTGGQFHILSTPEQKIASVEKEKLAKLIQAGGGTLLAREPKTTKLALDVPTLFHAPEGSMFEKCSVLVLFKNVPPEPMYSLPHMKHVSVQWLYDCIDTFSIVDF